MLDVQCDILLTCTGTGSPNCFSFSRLIHRPMWVDIVNVPFIGPFEKGEWELHFRASWMKDNIAEYLRRVVHAGL